MVKSVCPVEVRQKKQINSTSTLLKKVTLDLPLELPLKLNSASTPKNHENSAANMAVISSISRRKGRICTKVIEYF